MPYFFDTYVLMEFVLGNEAVKKFFSEKPVFTVLNLIELYYNAMRIYGREVADESFAMFKTFVLPIPDDVLKEAMEFKLSNKKKKLSYADCIGYAYAKKHNLLFLTGDKEFKNMENVEFVK